MHIFRATDIRVSDITIIADDIQHASHTLLDAFYNGLRHWPFFSYGIGPWVPPADMHPGILREFAAKDAGGLAHFVENGWEVIGQDRDKTDP